MSFSAAAPAGTNDNRSPQVTSTPVRESLTYRRLGSPLTQALLLTLVWRVLVAICGVVAHFVFPSPRVASFSAIRAEHWPTNVLTLALDAGARYDAEWYARLAAHGYAYNTHHMSTMGFYPLYPALIKVVSLAVGNMYIAGLLVSTACLFGAVVLLYLWLAMRGLGSRAPLVVACLLFYPFAVFYGAMYSESLFLLLVLGTFVCFEQARWKLASLCIFLALLTRPTGVVMLPSLLLMVAAKRSFRWEYLFPFLSAGVAISGFAAYQWVRFGTPLAYARSKAVPPWLNTPGQALQDVLLRGRPGIPPWYLGLMLAITLIFLALVPLVYRRFGTAYALYSALTVLVFVGSGLVSMNRYVIVDFPAFAAIALVRHTKIMLGVLTLSFWFMWLVVAAFATGWGIF